MVPASGPPWPPLSAKELVKEILERGAVLAVVLILVGIGVRIALAAVRVLDCRFGIDVDDARLKLLGTILSLCNPRA
jgi:ribose 5-phosphate isomerase RpiB